MAPVSEIDTHRQGLNSFISHIEKDTISISEYIYLRILQTGVKSIFGVPGDFNLDFLEHIYDFNDQLNWIGCCNELNAAYAADAYAKISKKIGVLVTTYGVGELSAINGISGSYAEYAPVLHIVGTSAIKTKNQSEDNFHNIHHLIGAPHTLQKPDHYIYEKMASHVSVINESLTPSSDPCSQIDRAIETVWKKSRPGYIFLPRDMVELQIPIERLYIPLSLNYEIEKPNLVENLCDKILNLLYKSENPSILADYYTKNFRMESDFFKLVENCHDKVNLYETFMGKGILSGDESRFVGTYCGKLSPNSKIEESFNESDFILQIGSCVNEVNYGFYTANIPKEKLVEMNQDYISIQGEIYTNVSMMQLLPVLSKRIDSNNLKISKNYPKNLNLIREAELISKTPKNLLPLSENDFHDFLQNFIGKDDILIIETCSFMFSTHDFILHGGRMIGQFFYNSIGYATPATLGASIALKDFNLPGRVITVEGDGSAQMTIQEMASLMRYGATPTLFILNNDGYTIERVIKGPQSSYNDIAPNWNWCQMLKTLGDNKDSTNSTKIHTKNELNKLMSDSSITEGSKLNLVELILDKFDVPSRLANQFS
ncbi:lyase activity protein [[Candida] boidinii]|nr:lyase activity protein [[Candida] boidinii]OWB74664.1 lyase activity protein [[Candida] boidinii]